MFNITLRVSSTSGWFRVRIFNKIENTNKIVNIYFIECLTIPVGILNFGRVSDTWTRPDLPEFSGTHHTSTLQHYHWYAMTYLPFP